MRLTLLAFGRGYFGICVVHRQNRPGRALFGVQYRNSEFYGEPVYCLDLFWLRLLSSRYQA